MRGIRRPLIAVVILLAFAGCGADRAEDRADQGPDPTDTERTPLARDQAEPTPRSSSTVPNDAERTPPGRNQAEPIPDSGSTVKVWFIENGVLVQTAAAVEPTSQIGSAAVGALLDGPTAEQRNGDLSSAIPKGAQLLGLDIVDGVATADLSSDFEIQSGTYAESTVLAQLVYTLTQFPTVDSVLLELGGKRKTFFGGHGMELRKPLTRANYRYLVKPPGT